MLEVAAHFHVVKGCVIKNGQHIVSVHLPTKKKRVREIGYAFYQKRPKSDGGGWGVCRQVTTASLVHTITGEGQPKNDQKGWGGGGSFMKSS